MPKIILIEDIVRVCDEINFLLKSKFDISTFYNARTFCDVKKQKAFQETVANTDFFLLDFNLGDATLMSSNIYEFILQHKKKEGIIICISSYGREIVDKNCELVALQYNLKSPFDYYLQKNPELISNFIQNFDNTNSLRS